MHIELEDKLTPGSKKLKLEAYTIRGGYTLAFQLKENGNTKVEEKIVDVAPGTMVTFEMRCTKDAIQMYGMDEFMFSSTTMHVDGAVPQLFKVTGYPTSNSQTSVITIKYSKLFQTNYKHYV